MQVDQFKEQLNEILQYWEEIEEAIKRAELLQGRVTLPAINELRYAGRQIIRAITFHGQPGFEVELSTALTVAKQYLINADHDVIDAVISFMGRRINELDLRYGRKAIASKISDYAKLCQLIEESMALIRGARRDPKLRNDNYSIIKETYFDHIINLNNTFVQSDTAMSLELAQYANKSAIQSGKLASSYIIISILVIIIVVMLLLRVF